jgi:hypothetical protein
MLCFNVCAIIRMIQLFVCNAYLDDKGMCGKIEKVKENDVN